MTPDFTPNEWFIQCVGIDIAKSTFTACMCMSNVSERQMSEVVTFSNTKQGFNQLVKWARKEAVKGYPIRFLMEATGVYYESLAYHLYRLKQPVYVVLANKVHDYAKYEGVKTKTDDVDARVIARMGCADRNLYAWEPPAPVYRELKQLSRTYAGLKKIRTALSNQLEAVTHAEETLPSIIKHYERAIAEMDKQIEQVQKEIRKKVEQDSSLSAKIKRIATIKGLGEDTIAAIVAETNGFAFITSRKQLASYAGLDVRAHASGQQDPKRHISKHGNVRLRYLLYMPALVATRYNPSIRLTYERINMRNQNAKRIGVIAAMRKLLLLVYTLWKNGEEYDANKLNNYYKKEVNSACCDLAR